MLALSKLHVSMLDVVFLINHRIDRSIPVSQNPNPKSSFFQVIKRRVQSKISKLFYMSVRVLIDNDPSVCENMCSFGDHLNTCKGFIFPEQKRHERSENCS